LSRRKRKKDSSPPPKAAAAPRRRRATVTAVPPDETTPEQHPNLPVSTAPRRILAAAVLLALGWWLVLGSMALFTANPVLLSRPQILQADFVVSATFAETPSGSITATVTKEWKQAADLGTILIEDIETVRFQPGEVYLVPVSRRADDSFEITKARLPVIAEVKEGQTVPFDAVVVEGCASVTAAFDGTTGKQPQPVARQAGDRVPAGSRAEQGFLKIARLAHPFVYPVTPPAIVQLTEIIGPAQTPSGGKQAVSNGDRKP